MKRESNILDKCKKKQKTCAAVNTLVFRNYRAYVEFCGKK